MSDGELTATYNDNLSVPHETFEYTARRVLAALVRQWRVISICVFAAILVGVALYLRAEPEFRATSALMIQQSSPMGDLGGSTLDLDGYSEMFASDAVLSKSLRAAESLPPELDMSLAEEYWPGELMEILTIAPRRSSNIIDLTCQSQDPKACVDVLNAIVDASLEVFGDAQKSNALELVSSLDKERHEIEQQLRLKEQALLTAKQKCGDIGIGEGSRATHPTVQRALELNNSLILVQKERIEKEALLRQVESTIQLRGDLLQHVQAFETILGKQFDLTPLGLTKTQNEQLLLMQEAVRDSERHLADIDKYYGPAHPKHIVAREQLAKSQARLESVYEVVNNGLRDEPLGARMVAILQASIRNAQQHEAAVKSEYDAAEADALALNNQLAEIAMTDRQLSILRTRHQSLLDRVSDIDVNSERASVQIMVVSDATLPTAPYSPNMLKTFGFSLVGGMMLAFVVVYTLELFSGRFHSPEQLEHDLGHRVIATIGKLPNLAGTGMQAIHSFNPSTTHESESFRTLRASLGFAQKETTCLAISSSEPGDGKTTVTSNLAVSFAQANIRCLLIDADMRKPGLSKLFGKRGLPGLSDVLKSSEDIFSVAQERIHSTDHEKLDFMPCGLKPSDPTALLTSENMKELLGWALSEYDQVLIDCPPVLVSADASIAARLADGALLVVNPDKNNRRTVTRANDVLVCSGAEVIGTVINGASFAVDTHYYYYNYGEHTEAEQSKASGVVGKDDLRSDETGVASVPFPTKKPKKLAKDASKADKKKAA